MMDFTSLLNLQLMMLIEIAVGWFLRRKNIITGEGKRVITDLVIDLLLPCNIICAFAYLWTARFYPEGFRCW